ncbi:MAG: glycosyltransferase family 2 protein [Minisyncoccota bacterium]
MTGHDLVTVIVPCYNHRDYVTAAVESVLRQTHPAVQLVVIDDGSSDGSPELLRALAERHGFDLVLQANTGVCKALNRAIREHARGRWVALLASDDSWEPEKLARQLARLREVPGAEFCFSQAREFADVPGDRTGPAFPRRVREGWVTRVVTLRQHVPAGTVLFSRALYDRLGGFDEQLKEEDWDFVLRASALTPFAAVPAPMLNYRIHATNTMRVRARREIFRQKMLILSKNFLLVPASLWLAAVLVHFCHDVLWGDLSRRLRRGR